MALCGHLGGRHYTQKIIFTQGNLLSMVSVDHDDATFGFVPSFDGDAAGRYWEHYRHTRQAASASEVLPELLASLLAAQSGKQSICVELDTLAADLQQGRQYDAQGARTLMRTWLHKLPTIGYPAFDTQACPDRI